MPLHIAVCLSDGCYIRHFSPSRWESYGEISSFSADGVACNEQSTSNWLRLPRLRLRAADHWLIACQWRDLLSCWLLLLLQKRIAQSRRHSNACTHSTHRGSESALLSGTTPVGCSWPIKHLVCPCDTTVTSPAAQKTPVIISLHQCLMQFSFCRWGAYRFKLLGLYHV